MRCPTRLVVSLCALLCAAAVAGCGKHPDENARVLRVESEGLYLDLDELKYQVQISRQMNPHDPQDEGLLVGVPDAERELAGDETWFAVFMRVQNETSEPLLPSSDIEIIDTQENVFEPIPLEPANVFAYRSDEPIPPRSILPLPDTPAYNLPAQGSLILFKLKNSTLDNRPLELKIDGRLPPIQTGIVELDV